MTKESIGERVFNYFNISFMLLLMAITVYPFLHVAFASFSEPTRLLQSTGVLFGPAGFSLSAYKMVFENPMIMVGYKNTLLYVLAGTCINLLMTCLGAYPLSRKHLYFRNPLMLFITFTMFFSGGLIPTYLLVKSMGLVNSPLALILPNAMSVWNLIILRTGFEGIPVSLEESAKIDGANDFTILFRIILPLSLPVLAVMILFYGVGHWNAWFNAMIYLRKREFFPLQLVLREILIQNSTDKMMVNVGNLVDKEPVGETIKYATIIVATGPVIFIYPFLQKYFVKGVMIGAIKE